MNLKRRFPLYRVYIINQTRKQFWLTSITVGLSPCRKKTGLLRCTFPDARILWPICNSQFWYRSAQLNNQTCASIFVRLQADLGLHFLHKYTRFTAPCFPCTMTPRWVLNQQWPPPYSVGCWVWYMTSLSIWEILLLRVRRSRKLHSAHFAHTCITPSRNILHIAPPCTP